MDKIHIALLVSSFWPGDIFLMPHVSDLWIFVWSVFICWVSLRKGSDSLVPFLWETICCGIGTVSLSPFKFLVLASDGSYAVSTGFLKLLKRLSEIMGEFFVLLGGNDVLHRQPSFDVGGFALCTGLILASFFLVSSEDINRKMSYPRGELIIPTRFQS